jgi:hypothetical protein
MRWGLAPLYSGPYDPRQRHGLCQISKAMPFRAFLTRETIDCISIAYFEA